MTTIDSPCEEDWDLFTNNITAFFIILKKSISSLENLVLNTQILT